MNFHAPVGAASRTVGEGRALRIEERVLRLVELPDLRLGGVVLTRERRRDQAAHVGPSHRVAVARYVVAQHLPRVQPSEVVLGGWAGGYRANEETRQ